MVTKGSKPAAQGPVPVRTGPGHWEVDIPFPVESLADRVERLELEKRALELELELNILRARAKNVPGLKEF